MRVAPNSYTLLSKWVSPWEERAQALRIPPDIDVVWTFRSWTAPKQRGPGDDHFGEFR